MKTVALIFVPNDALRKYVLAHDTVKFNMDSDWLFQSVKIPFIVNIVNFKVNSQPSF